MPVGPKYITYTNIRTLCKVQKLRKLQAVELTGP